MRCTIQEKAIHLDIIVKKNAMIKSTKTFLLLWLFAGKIIRHATNIKTKTAAPTNNKKILYRKKSFNFSFNTHLSEVFKEKTLKCQS